MLLRASDLTNAAGITSDRFNNLRRRDQLPFDDDPSGEGSRAWGRYSIDAAVRLRLAIDLADNGGLAPGDAARLVDSAYGLLPGVFRDLADLDALAAAGAPGPAGDQWIGRAVSRFTLDAGTPSYAASHLAGALPTIIMEATARAERERAAYGEELVRLDMAAASAAARFVHARLAGADLIRETTDS